MRKSHESSVNPPNYFYHFSIFQTNVHNHFAFEYSNISNTLYQKCLLKTQNLKILKLRAHSCNFITYHISLTKPLKSDFVQKLGNCNENVLIFVSV